MKEPPIDPKIKQLNVAYRIALMCLTCFIAAMAALSAVQIYNVANKIAAQSQQITDQSQGIINYLNCVGHLSYNPLKRDQSQIDNCLNIMRQTVEGKR